jgi:DNA polymerase-3 subunit beta
VSHEVAVSRIAFIDALKAVSVASPDSGVKFTLAPGALRATTESAESGSAADEIPVDYDGPEISVGVSAKYILDSLNAMDMEEVLFGVSGELDPMRLRPKADGASADYVAVVMPRRL